MEENENSKEKLIENTEIKNQVRNNVLSGQQILPKDSLENLCCCCINYDLTVSEFKSFIFLKKKVIPSYNEENPEHENKLKDLLNKTKELLNDDNNQSEITEITTEKENLNENEIINENENIEENKEEIYQEEPRERIQNNKKEKKYKKSSKK